MELNGQVVKFNGSRQHKVALVLTRLPAQRETPSGWRKKKSY